jgi:regulator of protease activity HflC (stomatin/prohibitin superfamily)
MTQKRKAAADIFKEQNVMYQQSTAEEVAVEPPPMAIAPQAGLAPYAPPPPAPGLPRHRLPPDSGLKSSEELQLEKEPPQVRETGFWFLKRIIIPPNSYVVHTRLGRSQPVTLGLGRSFGYNPYTDAYLVVPAAMQTIGVVANCITKEKQGINILAYVQWQIDDFAVAYRKLDFSDSRDPLGIVNAQLREQAEAAVKDKIATMSVEEVLTDKAPIIEELTARLKAVTEGRNQGAQVADEGLGIKIVTVQIREAIVSSQRLWQDLQAPFRHEQEKTARISYLTMQDEIRQKELETRRVTETSEAETMVEIERTKQSKQTEALELRLREEATRFTREQETTRAKIELEEQTTVARRESEQRLETQAARIAQETELAALQRENQKRLERARLENEANNRQKTLQIEQALHAISEENRLADMKLQAEQQRLEREETLKKQEGELQTLLQEQADLLEAKALEARLAREQQAHAAKLQLEEEANRVKLALQEREIELARLRQEVNNLMNERDLLRRLFDKLPELAAEMPEIHELKVLQTGNDDVTFNRLSSFTAKALALAENLGFSLSANRAQAVTTQSEE